MLARDHIQPGLQLTPPAGRVAGGGCSRGDTERDQLRTVWLSAIVFSVGRIDWRAIIKGGEEIGHLIAMKLQARGIVVDSVVATVLAGARATIVT